MATTYYIEGDQGENFGVYRSIDKAFDAASDRWGRGVCFERDEINESVRQATCIFRLDTDSRGYPTPTVLGFIVPISSQSATALRSPDSPTADLLDCLDQVSAAAETMLAFYGDDMPAADQKNRREIVNRARKLADSLLGRETGLQAVPH